MGPNPKQTRPGLHGSATERAWNRSKEDVNIFDFKTIGRGLVMDEPGKLGWLLAIATVILVSLAVSGLLLERQSGTAQVEVGQVAPGFALPSTDGPTLSLSQARGHPVLLVFVPAVNCGLCRQQLGAVQATLSQLQTKKVVVYAISTDTLAVQRLVKKDLGLGFPILSEAPILNQHPVGSAYGFYHQAERAKTSEGPVDSNGMVMIDPAGIVRAVKVEPGQFIPPQEILQFAQAGLEPNR